MQVILPQGVPVAYEVAAKTFVQLYQKVTGEKVAIVAQPDPQETQLVVIGGDDVNDFTCSAWLKGWLPALRVRPGTDDYTLQSVEHQGRTLLFLAGGRGRSTLYAVYEFFSLRAACRYFWDGDVIPQQKMVEIAGLHQVRQPNFALRGLRHFAHRGLHRFQAEHWSLADWQQEIDWMLKRGLNLFMLRIGADDLFQKAFPQQVDYPPAQGRLAEAGEGYDERTLFWSLEYRGWLRQQILQYAFDRDLLHPEDCGTTTHWYTRTPQQFLDQIKPGFMPQTTQVYRQPTGLVWDIRKTENLDRYMQLTKAHVQHYGQPRLFHTIGLAERLCSAEREENMRYKKMAYRRILSRIEQEYPGAPVLVASWDFAMCWQPAQVRELLTQLDPARHIMFDYTADTHDPENNYKAWGFCHAFPWVFGIFHAFEPSSDLRGDYPELNQRLAQARADKQCKGLIFWPELSHSDILMLEYLVKSGWQQVDLQHLVPELCADRYPQQQGAAMLQAWNAFWPLLPLRTWTLDREAAIEDLHQECFFDVLGYRPLQAWQPKYLARWQAMAEALPAVLASASQVLAALAGADAQQSEFVRRDAADLARSALGRVLEAALASLVEQAACGKACTQSWQGRAQAYLQTLQALDQLLRSHSDYSQQATLKRLEKAYPVNPAFEPAFKQNLANGYCRGYGAEFVHRLCLAENQVYLHWLSCTDSQGRPAETKTLALKKTELYDAYMKIPLADMCPSPPPQWVAVLQEARMALAKLTQTI